MTGLVEHLDRVLVAMGPIGAAVVEGACQAGWNYELVLLMSFCDNRTLRLRIISFDSRLPNYPRNLEMRLMRGEWIRICSPSRGIFTIMTLSSTHGHGLTG